MRFWRLTAPGGAARGGRPPVDFARDVRPILSDRCFTCHGPDEATRKAGLRLDTEDGAQEAARAAHTRRPRQPGCERIIRRVAPAQPALRMPPPYSDRKPLTESEVATLRAWIEQGAKWQSHWAFTPPAASATARRPERRVGAQSDRPLRPRAPGARRPRALARSRPRPTAAPRHAST